MAHSLSNITNNLSKFFNWFRPLYFKALFYFTFPTVVVLGKFCGSIYIRVRVYRIEDEPCDYQNDDGGDLWRCGRATVRCLPPAPWHALNREREIKSN